MDYLYKPLDFFMMRTPIYPISYFEKIKGIANEEEMLKYILDNVINDEKIIEMIFVASPSLYEALIRLKNNPNIKKKERIILNLTKYLLRLSTRATPFGLFSGVSVGRFEEKTKITIDNINSFVKKARPDMEWLLGFIKEIESSVENVNNLKVISNPIAFVYGSRLNLSYNTQYGQRHKQENSESISSSIQYNEVIKKIFKSTKKPVLFSTLFEFIKKEYPLVESNIILNFMFDLLKNEYLISELRPVLTLGNPFKYVINKLATIPALNKYYIQLLGLKNQIETYNNLHIGKGTDILKNISNNMKDIYEVKTPLQIDLSIRTNESKINKSILEEISKTSEFLWLVSSDRISKKHLENYKEEFLEKYGEYIEVPLLELLDSNIGLGYPAGYLNPYSVKKVDNIKNNEKNELENYILNEISKHIINKNEQIFEINIDENLYKELQNEKKNVKDAMDSMELYFVISAKEACDIDKGNYRIQLAPNTGSDGAGKTFGRFMNLFDNDFIPKLRNINNMEKEWYEDTIFAEMVYLPDYGRCANVTITNTIRDYEIVIGTNSSKKGKYKLDIDDLFVGINKGRFYIRSKSLNKRVIIKTGHMLNIAGCHNISRFLKEISNDGLKSWTIPSFDWMEKMTFIPRINFGKVTILPAIWNLSCSSLDTSLEQLNKNFDYFKQKFLEWCNNYKLPRYSYIIEADNKILLDTKNNLHIKIIKNELFKAKDNRIKFYEFGDEISQEWIKGNGSTYLSEIVVPFIKNKELLTEKEKVNFTAHSINECDSIRKKYIGSDWIYFKIYGDSERQNELIANYLNPICDKLDSQGLIKKYFFIRYADPKQHIRLRFNVTDKNKIGTVISCISNYFNNLINDGIISNIVMDTYDREVERYGGSNLIEDVESLFFNDSKLVQEILNLKEYNNINTSFEDICVFSILNYLQGFELKIQQQLDYLNSIVNYKEYLNDFRKKRNILTDLCNKNNDINLHINVENSNLYSLLNNRMIMIKKYKKKLDLLEKQGKLFNSRKDIILSIIHLHCNRMIGIDRTYEKKLNTLARHTLKSLKYIYINS